MPAYKINKTTGNPDTLIAGGTLYADLAIGDIVSSGRMWDNPAPGFLFCGGQAISRTTYAALFAAIGTSFGEGDGSTTFNVPDLRGEFIRGAGTNQHTGQGNGGAPGYHQDGTTVPYIYSNNGANNVNFAGDGTTQNIDSIPTATNYYQTVNSGGHGTSSSYNFGTVRPTNTSVNFFIKAEQVAVPTDFISKVDEVYGALIPPNASTSNKLVAKSDTVIKHNYTMAGTASLEDDIKTFVTALIALGANTYVGFFNRSGSLGTAGNYSITVYAEEGTSTFASGYIVLGAGAMGKAQYEVSYYKPTGSSEEWNIKKLVTYSDTAKRKDVIITATASIEDDIKTLLDELIAETSGPYIGSFTRTGNTSGHYSVSIVSTWNVVGIVSICGATSVAYRVAKFKNTEQGAYTYTIEKLVANTIQSGTYTIPAQTLHNLESAEVTIPLTVNDFYCGRVDFANLPSVNMNLSYNDFSGSFQDARETVSRSQFVLYPIGKAYSGTLHIYLTNYTGADVAIGNVQVVYYLEHHLS